MYFHQSTSNDLSNLSRSLLKTHLITSVPILILLICTFTLTPFIINPTSPLQSPSFALPQLLQLYYKQCIQYVQFVIELVQTISSMNISNKSNYHSLKDTAVDYQGVMTGFICVYGSQSACNDRNLVQIAAVGWQYQTIQYIKQTIYAVIICYKTNLTCISSNNYHPLTSKQLSIITQSIQTINQDIPQLKLHVIKNDPYLLKQKTNIAFLIKLHPFQAVITKIMKQIQSSLITYYKISTVNPYCETIIQNNIDGNNMSRGQRQVMQGYVKQNLSILMKQEQQNSDNVKTNTKIIQFIIQYTVDTSYLYAYNYGDKLVCLVSLIYVAYIIRSQKHNIQVWVTTNFSRKKLINKLYKYAIRDIFICIKPTKSNILQAGPCSQLFTILSQLLDNNLIPVQPQPIISPHQQPFKFLYKLSLIIQSYKNKISNTMISKNKYIIPNNFNIQNYINDVCEIQQKILHQLHIRAEQLQIQKQFFKFAYMALLKNKQQYTNFIQEDQTPLPEKLLQYFVTTNCNIHDGNTILEKFDLFPLGIAIPESAQITHRIQQPQPQINNIQQNKQQLLLRIRIHSIQKYLKILRQLDRKGYAVELELDREIKGLGQIVQNMKLLLAKHNKSIRAFAK